MFCEVPPRVQVRGGVCVPETDSGFVLAEQKFPGGVVHASGEMFADACDMVSFHLHQIIHTFPDLKRLISLLFTRLVP